jgi:hypothetical protein
MNEAESLNHTIAAESVREHVRKVLRLIPRAKAGLYLASDVKRVTELQGIAVEIK